MVEAPVWKSRIPIPNQFVERHQRNVQIGVVSLCRVVWEESVRRCVANFDWQAVQQQAASMGQAETLDLLSGDPPCTVFCWPAKFLACLHSAQLVCVYEPLSNSLEIIALLITCTVSEPDTF